MRNRKKQHKSKKARKEESVDQLTLLTKSADESSELVHVQLAITVLIEDFEALIPDCGIIVVGLLSCCCLSLEIIFFSQGALIDQQKGTGSKRNEN